MGAELLAASGWLEWATAAWPYGKALIGLGFVIFVHELGHFLVAKACGVKCEKFYIGFDVPLPFGLPSKIWHVQWGETEYGIGILPLGGYVKMLGQDDNPLNAEEEAARTRLPTTGSTGAEGAGAESQRTTAAAPPSAPSAQPALDPRSYTAKSVPQRMAIISAGVIVNLIFAVIFAAFAYNAGVPITPCEIGEVVPGGPAWKAGLQPQTRIVQIGENGKRSEHLRFDWDLRQGVGLHGDAADLPLVVRDAKGNETTIAVRPVTFRRGWEKLSSIGITGGMTLELKRDDDKPPAQEGSVAALATPALQSGDVVVGIDGQKIATHHELTVYLAQHPEKSVVLQVQRKDPKGSQAPQLVDVSIAPQPRRTIGVIMEHGPITAIRPDSPAAKAGVREGDKLIAFNGEPLGDPMELPQRVRSFYGQEVELKVERSGESAPVAIRLTPVPPTAFDWDWKLMARAPMSCDALGIAFSISNIVKEVPAEGPAAKSGLQPGDKLVALKAKAKTKPGESASADKAKRGELLNRGEEVKIDNESVTWATVTQFIQILEPNQVFELGYQRGNSVGTAEVEPVTSSVQIPDRGLLFAGRSEIHRADSIGEAVALGFRQTWEDATRVGGLLRKLVTGRVSVTNLGGIGSIAYVAGSEASEGMSRLLIFLTMLSANLAVLNFLPIPALDGGHMVFLIYEGLFRKPVNERVQVVLTIAGVACLLGLMIFVNALDVRRFFF